jgi:hypothetical protein
MLAESSLFLGKSAGAFAGRTDVSNSICALQAAVIRLYARKCRQQVNRRRELFNGFVFANFECLECGFRLSVV